MRPLHHRTAEFSRALVEMVGRLRPLYGTGVADILPIHGTGRAGLEAAVVNLLDPGDTLVACCNGKFGEMWARLGEVYGVHVVRVAGDWERSVDPGEVEDALERHPGARAVSVVHSETSTGALNPVEDVARVARARNALVIVDAVSSLGGVPFHFDAWGVDLAVSASQKCLMSGPGLAFIALSERARDAALSGSQPRAYLDFRSILASMEGPSPQTPGTAPVMLVLQVLEALRMIDEEGIGAVFARHRAMAARVRAWAADRELDLVGSGIVERSPTLTALRLPPDTEALDVRAAMGERGIDIATGRGVNRGSGVRIGHLGDIRMEDVERTLEALDEVLDSAGAESR